MRKQTAIRKVERAIDCLVDLQDAGLANDTVVRVLEMLNCLASEFESRDPKSFSRG